MLAGKAIGADTDVKRDYLLKTLKQRDARNGAPARITSKQG